MISYHTISKEVQNIPVYAFDKLDGSNIRAEWNKKNGFYKFGSRNELIDSSHSFLGEAPSLILNKYAEELHKTFSKERFEKVVCFFEFYGENSFAGTHKHDEKHDVVLFDIHIFKKGFLNPKEFVDICGNLHIPRIVYKGNANHDFVNSIKENKIKEVTFEGVVCKSVLTDKYRHPIMFKVKTNVWLEKLKNYCGDNTKLFEQLS